MWNPFNRQSVSEPDIAQVAPPPQSAVTAISSAAQAAPGEPSSPQPSANATGAVKTRIAEIEIMGETAVATLTITELTQEKGVEWLTELLADLSNSGARHFVLDIQNVQFMDSACIGCLVQALNVMAGRGGRIALANTANSVQYLFRMTQLDRVFPICSDVMAALAAIERATQRESAA